MTKLEYVEKALLDQLAQMLDEMETKSGTAETGVSNIEMLEKRLAAVRKELAVAEKRKRALYEFLEDGTYSRTEFRERMETAKKRVAELERQEQDMRLELDAANNRNPERLSEALRTVLKEYWTADVATRNAMLKGIIQIVWYSKERKTKPMEFSLEIVLKDL